MQGEIDLLNDVINAKKQRSHRSHYIAQTFILVLVRMPRKLTAIVGDFGLAAEIPARAAGRLPQVMIVIVMKTRWMMMLIVIMMKLEDVMHCIDKQIYKFCVSPQGNVCDLSGSSWLCSWIFFRALCRFVTAVLFANLYRDHLYFATSVKSIKGSPSSPLMLHH